MKKMALMFVGVALLVLTIVPAINLTLGTEKKGYKWWSKSVLFNLDFALPYLSHLLYPFGISTDPDQVIIGKNDWLYLGDYHNDTISVTRRGAVPEDEDVARKIRVATNSWEQWLKLKGVRDFRIVIGPDKSTIYPEFLPDWARPAADSATNSLLANVDRGIYVDTRSALIAAKSRFPEPLYYRTDTHWNSLGAWVAFQAFISELARADVELKSYSAQQMRVLKVNECYGRDLARFLRMTNLLRDKEVVIDIGNERTIETEQYDFETGQLTASGGNPVFETPQRPLLVKSKHALNQKKVLWLHDSFGEAMAPFMAATFSETLQLHFDRVDPLRFAQLVDTYKPELVVVTIVERDARKKRFENLPPQNP